MQAASLAGALGLALVGAACAADMTGVTDTKIRTGDTMPYSGLASSYGQTGHAMDAYFDMVPESGGVNGRRIRFNRSRENIMKQAISIQGLELPLLLPGITVNTSAHDYAPIKQACLARFDGQNRVPGKEPISAEGGAKP